MNWILTIHPAYQAQLLLKRNKQNMNNMLTLLFYFPYNLLLLIDTNFINVDKYKHTNESKTNEQNMHS